MDVSYHSPLDLFFDSHHFFHYILNLFLCYTLSLHRFSLSPSTWTRGRWGNERDRRTNPVSLLFLSISSNGVTFSTNFGRESLDRCRSASTSAIDLISTTTLLHQHESKIRERERTNEGVWAIKQVLTIPSICSTSSLSIPPSIVVVVGTGGERCKTQACKVAWIVGSTISTSSSSSELLEHKMSTIREVSTSRNESDSSGSGSEGEEGEGEAKRVSSRKSRSGV